MTLGGLNALPDIDKHVRAPQMNAEFTNIYNNLLFWHI